MNKIKEYIIYIINLIWSYLQLCGQYLSEINIKLGIIDKKEIENYSITKSNKTAHQKEKPSQIKKNTQNKAIEQKSQQKNADNTFTEKNSNLNKVINTNKYNPLLVNRKKTNLIKNYLFRNQLSDWNIRQIGRGKVKILKSKGYLSRGKNKLMLSIPECTNNSLAGIKQFLKLKNHQFYEIMLTARTDSITAFPLLYLTVENSIYNIHCQPDYNFYKIAFKNSKNSTVKITINTGYKLANTPTTFYIDNILLYEKN